MARPGENAINCDCDVGVCDIITFCHDCHYPHRLRSAGSGRFSLSPSSYLQIDRRAARELLTQSTDAET